MVAGAAMRVLLVFSAAEPDTIIPSSSTACVSQQSYFLPWPTDKPKLVANWFLYFAFHNGAQVFLLWSPSETLTADSPWFEYKAPGQSKRTPVRKCEGQLVASPAPFVILFFLPGLQTQGAQSGIRSRLTTAGERRRRGLAGCLCRRLQPALHHVLPHGPALLLSQKCQFR